MRHGTRIAPLAAWSQNEAARRLENVVKAAGLEALYVSSVRIRVEHNTRKVTR